MTPDQDLPKPVRRKQIHTRTYQAQAYERDDGLFDVEVDLRDTKPFSFENSDRGYVAAGEPLHHMKMRVTVSETMEITDVEARTLASPYHICANITPSYKKLIGLRIVGGFTKRAQDLTGRAAGCTHLNDMLKVIGTTAFQGLWTIIARRRQDKAASPVAGKTAADALLNSCHAYEASSPIVKRQWPEAYVEKQSS